MSRGLWVLGLLVGCGPAPTPKDTDPPYETGLDTDTDGPVATSTAPSLSRFEVTDAGDGVADISFQLNNLEEDWGHLNLLVEGQPFQFDLPEELDVWGGAGQTSHVKIDVPGFTPGCGSPNATRFVAQAWDLDDNPSEAVSADQVFLGDTVGVKTGVSVEPDGSFSSASNLGTLAPGAVITGTVDDDADDDYLMFTVCASANYAFELSWTNSNDINLYLHSGTQSTMDSASSSSGTVERVDGSLTSGETYYVRVHPWASGFNGPEDWTLTMDQ